MTPTCSDFDPCRRCFSEQDAEPWSRAWLGGQCRRHQTIRTEHSPAPSELSRTRPHVPPTPQRRHSRPPHRPGQQKHLTPAQTTAAGSFKPPVRRPAVGMDDTTKDLPLPCRRPLPPLYRQRNSGTIVFQKDDLLQFDAYHPAIQDLGTLLPASLSLRRPIFPLVLQLSMRPVVGASLRPATPPIRASRRACRLRLITAMPSHHPRQFLPHPLVVSADPSPGAAISSQS